MLNLTSDYLLGRTFLMTLLLDNTARYVRVTVQAVGLMPKSNPNSPQAWGIQLWADGQGSTPAQWVARSDFRKAMKAGLIAECE